MNVSNWSLFFDDDYVVVVLSPPHYTAYIVHRSYAFVFNNKKVIFIFSSLLS